MGEHHLAKILIKTFLSGRKGNADIFERQALEPLTVLLFHIHRNQSRGKLRDLMAQLFCKAVAVARGARAGIGKTAGSQNHHISHFLRSVRKKKACHLIFFRENFFYFYI